MIINLIYHFFIWIYTLCIKVAAPFNPKAKAWVKGRKNLLNSIKKDLSGKKDTIWVHCASLGEFEQGRPIIENYRKQHPNRVIVLTFYSPSGYEMKKNYEQVNFVYYLPADTIGNAKLFLDLINPKLILFIKYEFWFGFLYQIKKRSIEAYLISAKFNPNSYLFKWYGKLFLNKLRAFKIIFVQDETSHKLAKQNNLQSIISGDTRFDRVKLIADKNEDLPLIKNFIGNDGNFVVIGGSTWPPEEKIISKWIITNKKSVKWIIAPHNINPSHIQEIQNRFGNIALKYSDLTERKDKNSNILIIDNIGILSKIYKYTNLAIIGGGFGEGIHNTQEAIVHGIPVMFGPKYHKFNEAIELVKLEGAFSFKNELEFNIILDELLENRGKYDQACKIAKSYVESNLGATNKIMGIICNNNPS